MPVWVTRLDTVRWLAWIVGLIAAEATSAQVRPVWVQEGNRNVAYFGSSVASAGDVNGDGYDDVVVCAPGFADDQPQEGRAYLFLGTRFGPEKLPSWTFESDQAFAPIRQAAGVGDVNGDGYDDVVVGNDAWSNDQYLEGRALLFLGSANGLLQSPAWTAEGNEQAAYFGIGAPAGDVNGDGFDDVVVSALLGDVNHVPQSEGAAFVYLGSPTGLSSSPIWSAFGNQRDCGFGTARSAGDVNGDGYDDLLVSASHFNGGMVGEGRVNLYLGSPCGPSPTADWIMEGNQRFAAFGSTLSGAGDVNGDGYDDVLIGAWGYDGPLVFGVEGAAYLYLGSANGLGPTPAWTATGTQADELFGCVAGAGDIDGDGYDDVLIGAPGFDERRREEGRACVYYGAASGPLLRRGWCLEGDQRQAELGRALDAAGDVDGDGFADVILGASLFDNGQRNEGRAWVFLGASRHRSK
jgi:hypothetical protein